ncbi:T. brucei spp.-specific protein [Trypanosoma brucei gambiense DAL972]|uniref:T. brucei spp.-specific protein n=2 Tax=Trypanosoma brucei TaxID=5691 RepID=C9ZNI6_TRYB9|nr:T. brucei spp.-specific protein [Trypanosoma brucei gambiense DAL972]RHW72419.1 hypothetical protein DPX39_050012500 [Trypanosoma brucei equiperdum]CBH10964.1 T. brucei spp.-specific protein [Trypanosoma brucei gambiense DAL972]|eukprot:XP_011773251.1 T. brucei spp.-specific protein [Trypanosoma brucei gambiense DAL972]
MASVSRRDESGWRRRLRALREEIAREGSPEWELSIKKFRNKAVEVVTVGPGSGDGGDSFDDAETTLLREISGDSRLNMPDNEVQPAPWTQDSASRVIYRYSLLSSGQDGEMACANDQSLGLQELLGQHVSKWVKKPEPLMTPTSTRQGSASATSSDSASDSTSPTPTELSDSAVDPTAPTSTDKASMPQLLNSGEKCPTQSVNDHSESSTESEEERHEEGLFEID